MIRFLVDHNFDEDFLRAAKRRGERDGVELQVELAREVDLERAEDPEILEWSAQNSRVVLTHDRNTLVAFAHERTRAGLRMAGVLVVDDHASESIVAEQIVLLSAATTAEDWESQVHYIPL